MGFLKKSYRIISDLTPIKSQIMISILIFISVIIGFFSSFDLSLLSIIGSFVALFSGILFSFSFLMFEASKKKKNEISEIFDELGVSFNLFKSNPVIPDNDKYNQSDIFNRLRYIEFANTLFTLIVLLVLISILIFVVGILLGVSLDFVFLYKYQSYLYKIGITNYVFFVSVYVWVVLILSRRIYRFYMFELKI